MTITYTFAAQNGPIPLSELDVNFTSMDTQSTTDIPKQVVSAFTTTGTSTAYVLTPLPVLASLVTNHLFFVLFHTAAGATPTLAISGLTAKNLKYRDTNGSKVAVSSLQIPTNWSGRVLYDGTDYVLLDLPEVVRELRQNIQSASYTTVLADSGFEIYHPVGDNNARTFTIDSNSNVPYPVGTPITFTNMAATASTIAITSDTLYWSPTGGTGSRTLAQYGTCVAVKKTSTTWLLTGTGLT